jgi:glucose/arabinose dehydrogenase
MTALPKRLVFAMWLCGVLACSTASTPSSGTAGTSGASAGTAAGGGGGAGAGSGAGAGAGSGAGAGAGSGGTTGGDAGAASDAGVDAGKDAGTGLLRCSAPSPASSPGNTCPASSPVALKATPIGGGFDNPVLVTHSPKDPEGRLFVVERTGSIKIIKNGTPLSTSFLDLSVVSAMNEQGLLGLAFDPNYETTGRFWVNYIGNNAGSGTITVVESYVVSANPDVADTSSKTPLLTVEDPYWNHNGGMLAFGPDHCLYIATGDGGSGNDPDGNGQDMTTALGKILRVDVADEDATPVGNLSGTTIPWLWDLGLRNPWRFSFDRATGDLYIGDVGQNDWEEINVEPRGTGNRNYGWRPMEGKHCRADQESTPLGTMCEGQPVSKFTQPVHDYFQKDGKNCVIGGYVYRGNNIPSLTGFYVFGDHGNNQIWAFVWNGTGLCAAPINLTAQLSISGAISSFGEDVDGELYITTESGNVYRIDPA